jgi:hypothetical protein
MITEDISIDGEVVLSGNPWLATREGLNPDARAQTEKLQ